MVFRVIGSWIGRQELRLGIRTGRLRQTMLHAENRLRILNEINQAILSVKPPERIAEEARMDNLLPSQSIGRSQQSLTGRCGCWPCGRTGS